uniref:aldehyde dehydrogenase family protein n=1 Tax=Burkholderia ubonensis TaxID=101571 RepID=UPI00016A3771
PHTPAFIDAAAQALGSKGAQTMLTTGIADAYARGVAQRAAADGVSAVAQGAQTGAQAAAVPALFATTQPAFVSNPRLEDEIFGPTSLIVTCRDIDEMIDLAEHVEGQLTATLHLDPDDYALARRLLPTLERKAGRILANGYPTGVEVAHAMVHGGPFPATSDSRTTSVGTLAIERFLRPVCYQALPPELLPAALQDGNPLGVWRLKDGRFGRE